MTRTRDEAPEPVPLTTALLVAVPEAERLVGEWRQRHDESARLGVPAHVTVLYPFLPLADAEAEADALAALFAAERRFDFVLDAVGRFPATCYLAPSPPERFVALTEAVWRRYPRHPPFAGAFASIVPHLTVAHGDADDASRVEGELAEALAAHGPVRSVCRTISLYENAAGRWRPVRDFALGPDATS